MRIISGEHKGRHLLLPKTAELRPTSDMVREAIFSTLGSLAPPSGKLVLDLYAGSGALGIEALSRGASEAWFVESERSHASIIEENLRNLNLENRARVINGRLPDILGGKVFAELCGRTFDLVLADPPYELDIFDRLSELLIGQNLVSEESILVYESDTRAKSMNPSASPDMQLGLSPHLLKDKSYGSTRVCYFGFGPRNV